MPRIYLEVERLELWLENDGRKEMERKKNPLTILLVNLLEGILKAYDRFTFVNFAVNGIRREPLSLLLVNILEGVVVALVIALGIIFPPYSSIGWLFLYLLIAYAGTVLAFHYCEEMKRKILKQKGYGTKSLKDLGATITSYISSVSHKEQSVAALIVANRDVMVDVVEYKTLHGHEEGTRSVYHPFTRIRVRHKGNPTCVVEIMYSGGKEFFGKDAYKEWMIQDPHEVYVPSKVVKPRKLGIFIVPGEKIPTKCPEEQIPFVRDRTRYMFDDERTTSLIKKGILRIEPEDVAFIQKGDTFDGEYLMEVINTLIGIAEKVEKMF